MYKHYLLKIFGTFTVFIDRAMIEFQKHRLINRGNTTPHSPLSHCHASKYNHIPPFLSPIPSIGHFTLNTPLVVPSSLGISSFGKSYSHYLCSTSEALPPY